MTLWNRSRLVRRHLGSRKSSEPRLRRVPRSHTAVGSVLYFVAARMADRGALEELVRLQGERVRTLKQQKAGAEQVHPSTKGGAQPGGPGRMYRRSGLHRGEGCGEKGTIGRKHTGWLGR